MANSISPMSGVEEVIQTNATTGNGVVLAIPNSFRRHNVTIKGSAGVSAGAVQLEASNQYDFAGTWAPIAGSPVSVGDNTELQIAFEGVYNFIRARVSTTIVGGTVTVSYLGGKA